MPPPRCTSAQPSSSLRAHGHALPHSGPFCSGPPLLARRALAGLISPRTSPRWNTTTVGAVSGLSRSTSRAARLPGAWEEGNGRGGAPPCTGEAQRPPRSTESALSPGHRWLHPGHGCKGQCLECQHGGDLVCVSSPEDPRVTSEVLLPVRAARGRGLHGEIVEEPRPLETGLNN